MIIHHLACSSLEPYARQALGSQPRFSDADYAGSTTLSLNAGRISVGPVPGHSAANASWVRALEMTARVMRNPEITLPAVIDSHAERTGDALALICDDVQMSYRALAASADKFAAWALSQGMSKGET